MTTGFFTIWKAEIHGKSTCTGRADFSVQQPVFFHFVAQGMPGNPQQLCRSGLIAFGAAERLFNK